MTYRAFLMSSTVVPLAVALLLATPSLLMIIARQTDTPRFSKVTNSFWYPSFPFALHHGSLLYFPPPFTLGLLIHVAGQVLLALVGVLGLSVRFGGECGMKALPILDLLYGCFV